MGFLWFLSLSLYSLFLCIQFMCTATNCFHSVWLANAECHEDESAALLDFKTSFVMSKSASLNPLSYPKLESWIKNRDCCSWHGVECDEGTGYVIGLNLGSSLLQGPLNPNSSLFHLVKLQSLSLADNNLSYSQIPSKLGDLSNLKYLNLSRSKFSGDIPIEIFKLSKLLSLDLSFNDVSSFPFNQLELTRDGLISMIKNLTNLKILYLSFVQISSPLPNIFTNLSLLQKLSLYNCQLSGEFPNGMFHLPNMRYLNLGSNQNLIGNLPEFYSSSLLETLALYGTSFHGTVPASIGNLNSLKTLSLSYCKFSGSIPSSLSNLTKLTSLDLGHNNFKGNIPSSLSNLSQLSALTIGGNEMTSVMVSISWIGKLTRLKTVDLSSLDIGSEIPSSFANLSQISILVLENCNISGEIPSWVMNLTNLYYLFLTSNMLHGQIPPSLSELQSLRYVSLCGNLLEGELAISKLLKLKSLTILCLSGINLSMRTQRSSFNVTDLPKFQYVDLISCNLTEFPAFLKGQDELEILDLSQNSISGTLPNWLWTMKNLWVLEVSNNLLTGEICPLICNLKSLEFLGMSFNNFRGTIPSCLGSFTYSLKVLLLQNNKFSGVIPQAYLPGSALQSIDFGHNILQGQLPKALINCKMLEFFDVSNNQINDSFPSCLGSLPQLKVLSLRSNKFFGIIRNFRNCSFSKLHIIDLSFNNFSGNFPWEITWRWKSMRAFDMDQLKYEQAYHYFKTVKGYGPINFPYSFTMFNKGNMMVYERLDKVYYFIAIDISNNKFDGEIPHAIGNLKGLLLLNLSNNKFTGAIPSSLGKLSQLESLDLSHNSLFGRIPLQLAQLTFLEVFDVSYNHLIGPIPQTKQFATFQISSFEGNEGLCGSPLLKKCESSLAPPSSDDDDEEPRSLFDFGWKVVLVGYGCGLVVGVVIGSTLSLERHGWLRRIYRF